MSYTIGKLLTSAIEWCYFILHFSAIRPVLQYRPDNWWMYTVYFVDLLELTKDADVYKYFVGLFELTKYTMYVIICKEMLTVASAP